MRAVPLNGGKQRRNNTVCVDGENRPNDKKIVWTTKPKCSKSQRCAILTIETIFIGKNRAEFKSFRLFCMLSLDWKFKKHIKNEQKNPILHFVFVAGIGSFSGFCVAYPVRSAEVLPTISMVQTSFMFTIVYQPCSSWNSSTPWKQ